MYLCHQNHLVGSVNIDLERVGPRAQTVQRGMVGPHLKSWDSTAAAILLSSTSGRSRSSAEEAAAGRPLRADLHAHAVC